MSINISQQTEARLTEEVRRQGITVDELLERFINECEAGTGHREAPRIAHLASWASWFPPQARHLRRCPLSRE
jgi:hypothetical protein